MAERSRPNKGTRNKSTRSGEMAQDQEDETLPIALEKFSCNHEGGGDCQQDFAIPTGVEESASNKCAREHEDGDNLQASISSSVQHPPKATPILDDDERTSTSSDTYYSSYGHELPEVDHSDVLEQASSSEHPLPSAPLEPLEPPSWYIPDEYQYDIVIFYSPNDTCHAERLRDVLCELDANINIVLHADERGLHEHYFQAAERFMHSSTFWFFLVSSDFENDAHMRMIHNDSIEQHFQKEQWRKSRVPVYLEKNIHIPFLRGVAGLNFLNGELDKYSKSRFTKALNENRQRKQTRREEMRRKLGIWEREERQRRLEQEQLRESQRDRDAEIRRQQTARHTAPMHPPATAAFGSMDLYRLHAEFKSVTIRTDSLIVNTERVGSVITTGAHSSVSVVDDSDRASASACDDNDFVTNNVDSVDYEYDENNEDDSDRESESGDK